MCVLQINNRHFLAHLSGAFKFVGGFFKIAQSLHIICSHFARSFGFGLIAQLMRKFQIVTCLGARLRGVHDNTHPCLFLGPSEHNGCSVPNEWPFGLLRSYRTNKLSFVTFPTYQIKWKTLISIVGHTLSSARFK